MKLQRLSRRVFEEDDDELTKFTKLIEHMFKQNIAHNVWMQPCPENNKFDRFLNSFPTTLPKHQSVTTTKHHGAITHPNPMKKIHLS